MASTPKDKWLQRYGPWALITGASDGIGEAFAHDVARRGAHVVLAARRLDRLQALGHELEESHGIETRAISVDLSKPHAATQLVEETADLDIGLMIASAGFGTSGAFLSIDVEDELSMIDVNCRSVLEIVHAMSQRMKHRGGGLVLMSSIVAFQGTPRAANYAATKAYIQTLAEGLAPELARDGIDVLASAPGPVASGFAKRANMMMGAAEKPEQVARTTLDALGRKRLVRPGLLTKVLSGSMSMLPRRGRSAIMQSVMQGMTKHQNAEKR